MALPVSPNSISMAQVNTELGLSATANITLNNTAVRSLFGKPSGAISMSDGYGKYLAAEWEYSFTINAGIVADYIGYVEGVQGSISQANTSPLNGTRVTRITRYIPSTLVQVFFATDLSPPPAGVQIWIGGVLRYQCTRNTLSSFSVINAGEYITFGSNSIRIVATN